MKADLHIHTTFSDGASSPKDVVNTAIEKGIDCICITDHDEIKGAIEAMKFAFDKNILVIPGIETTTTFGHILGIGIKKAIPKNLPPEKAIDEIRKQGGLAIIAHPFDWPAEDFIGGEEKICDIKPDGIEVFNASVFVKSSNKRALDFAKKNNFIFTAGSDAHRAEFIGRGYLDISKNVKSEKDLITAIKEKKGIPKGNPLSMWELIKMARDIPFSINDMQIFNKLKAKIKGF